MVLSNGHIKGCITELACCDRYKIGLRFRQMILKSDDRKTGLDVVSLL